MGSIDLTAVLEPLHFLLPHRELVETPPTDTELKLPEEPAAVLSDSEKTEQLEEVEQEEKEQKEEEGETAHEEFSLE